MMPWTAMQIATRAMVVTTLVSGENDLTWDAGLMRPDLVITKGNSINGPVYLGQSFTWTIEVRNNGSSATFAAGYNFIMRDVLPTGATYSNVSGPNPAIPGLICEIAGTTAKILRCRAGTGGVSLEAGAGFTVSVDVTPTQAGTLDNTAVVDFQNSAIESNEENNSDSDSVEVLLPASLGDYVWEDLNLNGIQETGEPGVAGVTVNLKDGTGTIVDTTTTDSNGYYLFDNLVPGDYSVEVVKPAGYEFTLQDQGGYDTLDSDVNGSGATIITTLVSGENDLTWDAGIYRPASLGNFVWDDLNLNGIQDNGEPGVAGVTVNLYSGTGTIVGTVLTDSNGYYLFDNLVPGDYSVEIIKPAGYGFSPQDQGGDDAVDSDAGIDGKMAVTTLEPGENDLTWDAGLVRPDLVINKENNTNGSLSLGETFTWTIVVTNSSSAATFAEGYNFIMRDVLPEGATYANVSGTYSGIPGLICEIAGTTTEILRCRAGTGGVTLEADASFTVTVEVTPTLSGTLENTAVVDFQNGVIESNEENNSDSDRVEVLLLASLGDYVWEDLNRNGIQDNGEPGVAGVTVNLKDGTGAIVDTMTTDGSGYYLFDNLEPGDYSVEVVKPAGYEFTLQDQGGDNAVDSDVDSSGAMVVTTLEAGENDLTWDAGIYRPASIGNFVWKDMNRNGIQDIGEPGVAGVTVNLKDGTGAIVDTMTTDSNGYYMFENLVPGDYSVEVVKPTGYEFTLQDQLSADGDYVDSDADPATGAMIVTTLEAGENDLTWDAGIYMLASIGNFVWEDLNLNGVQDSGEAGVAGVTVNLKDGTGAIVGTMTTDSNGSYVFENLVPGDYSVEVVKPAGYEFTLKDQVSADGDYVDSDADPATGAMVVTTLEAGENDLTWDAGIYRPASIGNFVWEDLNRNGVQDSGEPGIAGVTVNLKDGTGAIVDTMTTDNNGYYMFENLVPGDYSVEVIKPAGYEFAPQHQGGDDYVDSDADPATGAMDVTTLESGENDLKWDAGLVRLDLTVDKSNDASTPLYVGDTFTWTMVVSNNGGTASFAAGEVVFSDNLPSGASYANVYGTPAIPNLDCGIDASNVVFCNAMAGGVNLASGEGFTITVDVTPTEAGTLENTTVVDPGQNVTESDEENNSDTDSVIVLVKPDLSVVKTNNGGTPLYVGDTFTWTMVVSNSGGTASFAEGQVVFRDSLPSGATYANVYGTPAVPNLDCGIDGSNVLFCNAMAGGVNLAAGQGFTITVDVTPTQAGTLENTAVVDPDLHVTETDEQNNSDSDSLTILVLTLPGMNITKTADVDQLLATAGDQIVYTYTLENTGNVALNGVTVDDDNFTSGIPGDDFDVRPYYVSGDNGNSILDVGETWTYTYTHTVTQAQIHAGVDLVNVVTADSNETEADTATETVTVTPTPGMNITKTADVDSVDAAGDQIVYTYTLENTGNVALNGVTVDDDNFTSGIPGDDFDVRPYYVSGDNGNSILDVGETWTYTYTHTVTQAQINAGADLVNVVTADSDETEADTATETVTVTPTPA